MDVRNEQKRGLDSDSRVLSLRCWKGSIVFLGKEDCGGSGIGRGAGTQSGLVKWEVTSRHLSRRDK